MPTTLQLADHIVIIGYFALLAMVGAYLWKRMRHTQDFFSGGNKIPWWLAGISFYLGGFSAFAFVAYAELAYRYGLVSVTLVWSAAVAMTVGTLFLARRWRRARINSPVEFLEARYNQQIRQILAWTGLPLRVIDDGIKVYATAVFVSVVMGYGLKQSIIAIGVVMILYTFMGGLWAVVVTNFVQFIILTLAVTVLFSLVFGQPGVLGRLGQGTPAGFWSPVSPPFSLFYVLVFYLLIVLSYNGNWALAQKLYCVRDEREARKAGMLGVALALVSPPLFILPAMAARTLLPELMTPPNSPQSTYAALSLRFLPAGLMGLMVAAMLSATMASCSGDYNVVASVITEDIYRRVFDKEAGQRRLMVVGRLATFLIGALIIGVGVSLVASASKGLFELMLTVFGIFVGPLLIPMLAGLLSRRVTWRGAEAGIVAGFVSGLSLFFYKTFVLARQAGINANWLRYDFEAISIVINFSVTVAAMLIATAMDRTSEQDRKKIDEFFARLSTPIEPTGAEAPVRTNVVSPFRLVGWTTIGTGLLLFSAAAVQAAGMGRAINVGAGIFLCGMGAGLHHVHRKVSKHGQSS